MKKIIFLIVAIFLSVDAFALGDTIPGCTATAFTHNKLTNPNVGAYSKNCTALNGAFQQQSENIYACKTNCTCPPTQKLNTKDVAGVDVTMCVDIEPTTPTCDAGQQLDARGKCNTKCDSTGVYNVMADACQPPANCTYPQLYNVLENSCSPNPNMCANGASRNAVTGGCWATGSTSCPAPNYSCADSACTTCVATGNSNASQGSTTSSGSNGSTGTNTSSGSNTSTAPDTPTPKPPITNNDNSDQGQSGSTSKPIPATTSTAACLTQNSAQVCNDFQNCQLTFGVGKCVGVSDYQGCPNAYILNGQKYCVLDKATSASGSSAASGGSNSSAGSGSNGSSGNGNGNGNSSSGAQSSEAGECDPTAKNYMDCITGGSKEMPEHMKTDSGKTTIKEVNDDFKSRVVNSPVVKSFDRVSTIVQLNSPTCPIFSFSLFQQTIATTLHCDLWDLIKPILSLIMAAVWIIIGFKIFASA